MTIKGTITIRKKRKWIKLHFENGICINVESNYKIKNEKPNIKLYGKNKNCR
jgi:hypothetical protein